MIQVVGLELKAGPLAGPVWVAGDPVHECELLVRLTQSRVFLLVPAKVPQDVLGWVVSLRRTGCGGIGGCSVAR